MINWMTEYLETVDSTNSEVKRRAEEGAPHGLVIIAGEQTGGRGRLGRSFHSPRSKGLYLTALLRPELAVTEAVNLTAWTAVAVCDGIEAACALRPQIKWTNDLVLNAKKLCGILVEAKAAPQVQYVALGIGVNANHAPEDFPPELRGLSTSLSMELGQPVDMTLLSSHILRALSRMYAEFPARQEEWLARYRHDCLTVGREVLLLRGDTTFRAFAEGIDDNFGLKVRYPDGSRETVTSGEVSVRGLLGYI